MAERERAECVRHTQAAHEKIKVSIGYHNQGRKSNMGTAINYDDYINDDEDDVDISIYMDESDEPTKEEIDDEIWRGYMRQIGFNRW